MGVLLLAGCGRMDVIIDSDANAELDDQHAIAYTVLNVNSFRVLGITVNATSGGGSVEDNAEEAGRVLALCGRAGRGIEVFRGAAGKYDEIYVSPVEKVAPDSAAASTSASSATSSAASTSASPAASPATSSAASTSASPATASAAACGTTVLEDNYDGKEAVQFILRRSRHYSQRRPLTIIAIGKLTDIALAIAADPGLARRIRVVWAGTGYPAGGEFNLLEDTAAANAVMASDVPLEILPARYGLPSGTWAVRVKRDSVLAGWEGLGPRVPPVEGRHGGTFERFGEYSCDLFRHIRVGSDESRSLFDLTAPAILKNPAWGHRSEIPASEFIDGYWYPLDGPHRTVTLWEDFDKEAILGDFLTTLSASGN